MISMSPRNIYIGVMSAAGLVLAAASLMWPGVLSSYASAFTILLVASFLVDIALMQLSRGGDVVPVSIEARFAGFFAGMAIYLALTALFGAPAT